MLCASLSLKASATQSTTVWLLCVSCEWEPWDRCWAASVGVFVLMLLRGFGSWPHLKVGYSSQAPGSGNNHITDFAIACLIGFWFETTGSERIVDIGTLLPLGHCLQQVTKLPFTPQGVKSELRFFFLSSDCYSLNSTRKEENLYCKQMVENLSFGFNSSSEISTRKIFKNSL